MSHKSVKSALIHSLIAATITALIVTNFGTIAYAQTPNSFTYSSVALVEPIPVAPPGGNNPPPTPEQQPAPTAPGAPANPGTTPTQPTADRAILSAKIKSILPKRATRNSLGTTFGLTFTEVGGETLHRDGGNKPLIPASTIKLFTAALALRALGPDTRLPTRVTLLNVEGPSAKIALVAGGDPLLSSANLRELAKKTKASLDVRGVNQVEMVYDDGIFPPPSPAPGWRASYGVSTIAPVRALVRDRRNLKNTSKDAASFFAKRLRAEGVEVKMGGRQTGTSGAEEIASYRGHTVGHAVRLMSVLSDNDIAENLFRHTAIARGFPPTWQGASQAMSAEATALGISTNGLRFVDGSGLSRDNRLTSDALVTLLNKAASGQDPALVGIADSSYLATAGRSGTLSNRYQAGKTTCSKGAVDGKTGSLRDVVALAGLATGVDGHRRSFAVLVNGPAAQAGPRRINNVIDSLATTLVGCR